MNLADWAGVLGLVIALGLALLKVWETFFARPKYEVAFSWVFAGARAGPHLEFTITNIGHAPGVITNVLFQSDAQSKVTQSGWTPNSIPNLLPIQLGVGQIGPILKVSVGQAQDYANGRGRIVLIGPRKLVAPFPIPANE